MTINFKAVLRNFDAAEITETIIGFDGKPVNVKVTLGRLCCNALLGAIAGEPPPPGDEQLTRYLLAERIRDNTDPDLRPEEIVLLKTRIAKLYPQALHSGQAIKMLDPAAVRLAQTPAKAA